MIPHPTLESSPLAPSDAAPQHGPRPLPLFLKLVSDAAQYDPELGQAALAGLRAYQDAPRPLIQELAPVVMTSGRAMLRDYGGEGTPLVVVPSLINPASILDLTPRRSLLRWLATQGIRPLLVDWGIATPADRDLDLAAHVEQILVPMIDSLGERPALAGYCLGGTIALAAAAMRPPRALALIATPWHFSGFGGAQRADLVELWQGAAGVSGQLGYLPMEVMQAAFWQLDPARTVEKYARYSAMDPASEDAALFVAMEDWANGGSPIPHAAARDLFEDFICKDLSGRGEWRIADRAVDPAALSCPVFDIISTSDRIVPKGTATGLPHRLKLSQGHVGMVAGGRAMDVLWRPLAAWLAGAIG